MKWFCTFVVTAVLAGCSPARVNSDENAAARLCEIEIADSHVPNVEFFHQDLSKPNQRLYECTLLVEDVAEISQEMRRELEPWCRGKINLAMYASEHCYGTKFAHTANTVQLRESLGKGDVETLGSVYMLVGETAN